MDLPAVRHQLENDIKRLYAPEGYLYAGLPHFKRLFGRDSLITSWQLLAKDPAIARSTLKILAEHQGKKIDSESEEEPGKIPHEYYPRGQIPARFRDWLNFLTFWRFPYYGSVDATPLFCIVAERYVKQTQDQELLFKLWPHIIEAVYWMIFFGDKDGDGYIEYLRKNPRGLLHQGWKDSVLHGDIEPPVALVEAQGYFYAALQVVETLARAFSLEIPKELGNLRSRASRLKKRFQRDFWIGGYFVFGLDRNKERIPDIASNPGHLLFTGILEKEKEIAVVKRLFAEDLWTPFGIRTLSTQDPHFDPASYHLGSVWPHDNWMIWIGLISRGFFLEAEKIKVALSNAFDLFGRIPEHYGVTPEGNIIPTTVTAAHPQAWASAGLLSMLDYYAS